MIGFPCIIYLNVETVDYTLFSNIWGPTSPGKSAIEQSNRYTVIITLFISVTFKGFNNLSDKYDNGILMLQFLKTKLRQNQKLIGKCFILSDVKFLYLYTELQLYFSKGIG